MVFPTDVSSSVPRLRHPAKGEWSCLLRKVKPFILRLRADRVLMFWMLPEIFGKMVDNFFRTTKEASVQSDFESEKIYFDKLHNRYNKPVQAKENTDVHLGYQVDKHTFLVKAYSTFGGESRRPIPLASYRLLWSVCCFTEFRKDSPRTKMFQKEFLYEDQFMYEKYERQPNSAYCVPSGTRYLTMTCVKKTLFSIHVASPDAALPELNLLSPTSNRKLNATQTPRNM
ncbi:uncharacterized protein CEXT_758761 [Caerostris extrusa]|uniref:Uncharacterized protein n=1 Tax=Caerostris extrusa TaxID=172846 RepID=A0AAV4U5J8_CAEEX|nr:uncharacterized protein CEXT_758761 [Caerostris extrusa]